MTEVAVVTGASGALGSAISARLAADGFEVVGADVKTGIDLTNQGDVERVFADAGGVGRLAAVVLAAGVVSRGPVSETSLDEWNRVLGSNLTASFLCARAAARCMRPGPGSIVFISSQAGLRGAATWAAYSASKFAVIGLMQSLAQELTPHGVRVNAVCPGSVDTPMLRESSDDLERQRVTIPAGRFAKPSEVAAAASFLCSPDASYISGSTLTVDGGELS